jgi:hypothetical protein
MKQKRIENPKQETPRRLIFDRTIFRGSIAPKYQDFAQVEWFRKFTLWERIKILLGMNCMIYLGMVTQHRPGYADVQIALTTTKHENIDEHLREGLKLHLRKQHPEAFNL